jgi:hypothetical protein
VQVSWKAILPGGALEESCSSPTKDLSLPKAHLGQVGQKWIVPSCLKSKALQIPRNEASRVVLDGSRTLQDPGIIEGTLEGSFSSDSHAVL